MHLLCCAGFKGGGYLRMQPLSSGAKRLREIFLESSSAVLSWRGGDSALFELLLLFAFV